MADVVTQEERLRWAAVAAQTINVPVKTHWDYEPGGLPAITIADVPVVAREDERGIYWEVNDNDCDCYSDLGEALCEALASVAFDLAEHALDLAGLRGEG